MDNAAPAVSAIVVGLTGFAMGLYAYAGRSAPQYFTNPRTNSAVPMFMPAGLGFACAGFGLSLVPSPIGGALVFGGMGLIVVGIIAGIWHPQAIRPWWLKEDSISSGGDEVRRWPGSVLDDPPRGAPASTIAPTSPYQERRRFTPPHLVTVLGSAAFTFLGVFGLLNGMPLWIAAPVVAFFGVGGCIATTTILLSVRRVALRVDSEGITFGGAWPRRPRVFRWHRVLSIWLWNTRSPFY
jgi:hypothetical protein